MHADELNIDVDLVRRLLAAQFPAWSDLPLAPVVSAGTDNAIFKLGGELAVRMPRIHWSANDPEKEGRWLARIARHLPVSVPLPRALGEPGEGYPWHWSIVGWLPGHDAYRTFPADVHQLALDLGQLVSALHAIDADTGPPLEAPAANRGITLDSRDAEVRAAIGQLDGVVDTDLATAAWQTAIDVAPWAGRPVWIHGDLQPTNLLVEHGRLTGVIDWGGLGVGDPAADLIPAWSIFAGPSRAEFRAALTVDDATWSRGRGWALSVGLIALPYYAHTNPVIVDWARRSIDAVLADHVDHPG